MTIIPSRIITSPRIHKTEAPRRLSIFLGKIGRNDEGLLFYVYCFLPKIDHGDNLYYVKTIVNNYYLRVGTCTFEIPWKPPKNTARIHKTTAMITTAFRMLFMFPSIGINLFTNQRRTPTTIRTTTKLIKGISTSYRYLVGHSTINESNKQGTDKYPNPGKPVYLHFTRGSPEGGFG
jgi:hypothetical protein